MTGRVVLVTGAARGLGAATVRALTGRGERVLAVDWCAGGATELPYAMASEEELAAVCDGERVVAHLADVRDADQLGAAVEAALKRWGRLDAAVAAAAVIAGGRPLWETSASELDLLLDIDTKGVWNTAAATVPAMLAGPDPAGCRFVAVASAAGSYGLHHLAAYNAAKHAVVGTVKGLAADLVGRGVTACVVSPGSTRTAMLDATAAIYGLESAESFAEHQLLRRLLEPEEVAETIAHCASPEGAALNGTVVHADGGFSP